jgi:hypothetical protein
VLEEEVLRPQLAQPWMLHERVVGAREGGDQQAELPPQAGARGVRSRQ